MFEIEHSYLSEKPYRFFRCCLSTSRSRMPWTALAKSKSPVGLSGRSLITLSASSTAKSSKSDSDSELFAMGFLVFFGRLTTSSSSSSSISLLLFSSFSLLGELQFMSSSLSSPSDVFTHSFGFFSLRLGSFRRSCTKIKIKWTQFMFVFLLLGILMIKKCFK